MTNKNWDDVDELLREGNAEDIAQIRCPDCGDALSYHYTRHEDGKGSFSYTCESCGILARCHYGAEHVAPDCVKYFGEKARIDGNLKLKRSA